MTYTEKASQVLAPKGDIVIVAQEVLINIASDTSTSSEHNTCSKLDIGGSISVPLVNYAHSIKGLADPAEGQQRAWNEAEDVETFSGKN